MRRYQRLAVAALLAVVAATSRATAAEMNAPSGLSAQTVIAGQTPREQAAFLALRWLLMRTGHGVARPEPATSPEPPRIARDGRRDAATDDGVDGERVSVRADPAPGVPAG